MAGHCHFSLLGQFGIAKLRYAAMAAGDASSDAVCNRHASGYMHKFITAGDIIALSAPFSTIVWINNCLGRINFGPIVRATTSKTAKCVSLKKA